jgi:ferritin
MTSKCRQNYHEECEAAINKQINMELYASYSYLAMVRTINACYREKMLFM